MYKKWMERAAGLVASFAEAWIEMGIRTSMPEKMRSPPSRRRGLKSFVFEWLAHYFGRLLRGGVD